MKNKAYTALAKVYDLFGEDDADARFEYYRTFLPGGGEGVDIGCGTGALTLKFWQNGYKVYGTDVSEEMLSRAVDKSLSIGANIRYILADAENIPYAHPLDFAVAACDVYNYVPRLKKAFDCVYGLLKDGGAFAFDISSEYKLKHILAGNAFAETKDDTTYVWQNSRSGNRLFIDFTVFSPQGASYIKTCETQVQYIRSEAEVKKALTAAGFTDVKAYAFGKKTKPRSNTERILFTAKKRKQE